MMSSGQDEPLNPSFDYFHSEEKLQADVQSAISQNSTLDDAIRCLFNQGYGKLLICRGLKSRVDEEELVTKRRVIRVINDLLTRREAARDMEHPEGG